MTVLRFILFYFALLLFTFLMMALADAQSPVDPNIVPPSEYDHPYDGELTLLRVPESMIANKCASAIKPGHRPLGCAQIMSRMPNRCTIWIVTDAELKERGWSYELVLRHETGHCNGWHHQR